MWGPHSHTYILQATIWGMAVERLPSASPSLCPLDPAFLLHGHEPPRSWLCAHMVLKCLLKEAAVHCEYWGPAPRGSDDSGQQAPPPISGSVPCHPTAGVPWLYFPSLSGF